jgi:hypothetical protein
MTEPYGQPEPFDPATMAPAARRPKPRSGMPILPVAGAIILAAVAFLGGFGVANAVAPKATVAAGGNGQGFGGQGFAPGASGRPRGNFGGGASGKIGSVSADQMTITTAAGGQRIVLLTPTTTVTQVTSTTKAVTDLTGGETVTVIGTPNPDGSVTATSVVIGDLSIFGRGRGFGGGPDGSPTPSSTP